MTIILRTTPDLAAAADVTSARDTVLTAVGSPVQTTDGRLDLLDVAVSTRSSTADVNAASSSTVTALQASLTSIAAQISDLAAAEADDATTAQLTSARDLILAAAGQYGGNLV